MCITEDDLEGINTLYPVCRHRHAHFAAPAYSPPPALAIPYGIGVTCALCSGALVVPVCDKSGLNIGLLRMVSYVIFPGVVGIFLSIMFHTFVDSRKAKELKSAKVQAKWLKAGNRAFGHAMKNAGDPAGAKEAQATLAAAKATELPSGVEVTVM